MNRMIAGIDVHKRMLMVVVSLDNDGKNLEKRRFGTTNDELPQLKTWLEKRHVQEVVMESTAQYWKPVWFALEGAQFVLRLAQAWSNRAPHAKKDDFRDAQRLVRRHMAGKLTLSFIPDPEWRMMRTFMRRRAQLSRDRVWIQNQVESLLEEMSIKLSSVITDLFGASGLRILEALVAGVTDANQLAALADPRVKVAPEEIAKTLTATVSDYHRKLLDQHLQQLRLTEAQMEEVTQFAAEMRKAHSDSVFRLAEIPGTSTLAAQQIIAEVGPNASAFPSPGQLSSWVGASPGRNESAEENRSSRCAKGNPFIRRALCQSAQAAVRTQNSIFQRNFNRLLPKKGYAKAVWAIVRHLTVVIWHILHEGTRYVEYDGASSSRAVKRRIQRLKTELRDFGFSDTLQTLIPGAIHV